MVGKTSKGEDRKVFSFSFAIFATSIMQEKDRRKGFIMQYFTMRSLAILLNMLCEMDEEFAKTPIPLDVLDIDLSDPVKKGVAEDMFAFANMLETELSVEELKEEIKSL